MWNIVNSYRMLSVWCAFEDIEYNSAILHDRSYYPHLTDGENEAEKP